MKFFYLIRVIFIKRSIEKDIELLQGIESCSEDFLATKAIKVLCWIEFK